MEQQIEREKQRLQYESKTRSQLYNMEMKKVLSIKEQEIEHFLGIQKELEMQLLTLREKQHMVSTQTQELKQTNSVLENQLHETLCQLQQTQRQLDTMKTKISQMHKEGRAFDDVASMSNADSEPRTRVISIKEDPMANSTGGEQYSPQQPSGQSSLFKELNEAIAALSQATESHQQQIDDLGVQGQELMDQIRQCRNSQKSFVQEKIPPKETVSKNSSLEQKISETLTGKARLQEEVFLKEGLTHIQVNSLERMENNLTVEVKTPDPMPRGSLIPDAQSSVYSGMMTDIGGDYKEGPLPGDTLALEQLNQPEHHKQGLKYSNIIQNEPLSTSLEERVIRLSPEMKMLDKPASKTLHSLAPSHFPLRIALPKVNVGSESKSSFAPNSQLRNMLEPETHAQNSEGLLLSEHGREGKMKECECNKDQEIRAVMDEEVKVSPNHRDCQMNEGTKETSKVTGAACSNPDHLYNVLFVGNTDVGKTSFLCRLQKNSFDANLTATIGIDYRIKNLFVDDKCFTLQLWDTAGQERYHSLTKQFFRKADGVVLMYDITSENSFADVRYWLSCIQEGAGNEVTVLLLGNKTDCTAERRVSIEDGEYLAKEYGFSFYECSAASGYNVNETMVRLVRLLKAREDQLIQEILELPLIPKKKNRCCS
ncbi:ras-related protein Rab-44 [Sceloporus undulatus]|uniref:ras-related protein Rab-44 n=1 Tax=Sceloporus undulatus TaxID=8520 RepID=UPI001C4D446F|nr:ras-related protein Rab-44 [Sceloporus undulatus]